MFKKLTLRNFKSFKELKDLELNDLTIVVGKNSCGKSSILQSLLLLKQTIESENSSTLNIDGRYLKFSNLKEISFGVPAVNLAKIDYEFHFESEKSKGDISFSFKNKKTEYGYSPSVDNFILDTSKDIQSTNNTDPTNPLDEADKINYSNITQASLKKYIQKRLTHIIDEKNEISNMEFIFDKFIPNGVQIQYKDNDVEHKANVPLLFAQPRKHRHLLIELAESIRNIRYLSPVRAAPERAYMHYSQDAYELHEDGSNSAHILYANQDKNVFWKGNTIKLKEAVNECLNLIGLQQSVSPDRIGDILYRIGIKEACTGNSLSLTDVGFGYSQILPVILLGLINGSNNLLLIEQPEIHLHPSSAANLADLFLSFIQDNKKMIIETHSQELINRLRLRVIENPSLKERINIIFVENNNENGSSIKQFKIDENGMFPEWPNGFLDESEKLAQAILEARLSRL